MTSHTDQRRIDYILHLADTAHLLGHQHSAWTGHGPILEQDIALSNITLDLIGQARFFYQYAAELLNSSGNSFIETEDSLAYLRDSHDYKNSLLTELPNGDWGQTILRQFFYSAFQVDQYTFLAGGTDVQLRAIAEKALKEVSYHLRWSSEWVIRLGDGTEESHKRMSEALNNLWPYTGELFQPASYEQVLIKEGIAPDLNVLHTSWKQRISAVLQEATLADEQRWQTLDNSWMQEGGKEGRHTEHLGYILAEMQFLQRAYPGNEW